MNEVRRRALIRRGFYADHDAECAAIMRGEVSLVYTPVGTWRRTKKLDEPNGRAAAT